MKTTSMRSVAVVTRRELEYMKADRDQTRELLAACCDYLSRRWLDRDGNELVERMKQVGWLAILVPRRLRREPMGDIELAVAWYNRVSNGMSESIQDARVPTVLAHFGAVLTELRALRGECRRLHEFVDSEHVKGRFKDWVAQEELAAGKLLPEGAEL